MPRIYNSCSDPLDFCHECFPDKADAFDEYGCCGDGPDDRGNCFGYDEPHPPYDDCDYQCESCRVQLTDENA